MVKISYRHKLENNLKIFRLTEKVKFYLPLNQANDLKNYQRIVRIMSELFGGTSSYEVEGSYVMDSGELVFDRVKVIESFASRISNSDIELLESLAREMGAELNQESIGLEVNGVLYFIRQD
jgi:hypothetical protein